jgi:uncharacterized FlaG/YvyC family protein
MNYDLFIPPAVVESAAFSVVFAGRAQTGQVSAAASRRSDLSLSGAQTADRPPRDSASEPLFTEEVDSAVEAFNEVFKQANVGVRYQVDTKTGDLVITLVDRDTQQVVRQVPPEEILRMRQRLEELLGVLFDQTA